MPPLVRLPTSLLRTSRLLPPCRLYSTHSPNARLNLPIDFSTTPLLHHTSQSALTSPSLAPYLDTSTQPPSIKPTTTRLPLHSSINAALAHALGASPSVLLFGEDVAFGGVFRCSTNLLASFGPERVFNTPLSEQGIVGFAIGVAMEGGKAVAEVQFADYVYPAFDQLVNEAAKARFRAGVNGWGNDKGTEEEGGRGVVEGWGDGGQGCGGLVVRMPCGGVGHGALYHSQSPESLFTHIPGLRVVLPRSPSQAKGLLLSAILTCPDPVLFLEPKTLYRAAVEHVPDMPYFLSLSSAEILRPGKDVTVISYGAPLYTCAAAIEAIEKDMQGVKCELIDLRTVYPWDRKTIMESVKKTGRAVIVHESMVNAGVGAEVAASIQETAFLRLEAPVRRIAGWSTHLGLAYERFTLPDVTRIYDGIKQTLEY
ncbi:MAG: hypothetical protein M1822_008635 [Bathelium mastoideum]|nr:MAG: hypothetical protein M1822_008635 [Bathelium mastoideum]